MHNVHNQIEAAYRRSDLFERRRVPMDDWARYLARGIGYPRQVEKRQALGDQCTTYPMIVGTTMDNVTGFNTGDQSRFFGSPPALIKVSMISGWALDLMARVNGVLPTRKMLVLALGSAPASTKALMISGWAPISIAEYKGVFPPSIAVARGLALAPAFTRWVMIAGLGLYIAARWRGVSPNDPLEFGSPPA